PLEFASPAPLEQTATSHDYHVDFAERESRNIQKKFGQGSWVFVMGRSWQMPGSMRADRSNPAGGILLRTCDGREVFDFSSAPSETYPNDLTKDPCGGGTVAVTPGLYLLERPGAAGDRLTQMITVLPGWQTQVVLLLRPPEKPGGRSLVATTIFTS